jgi:DNA-binding NarL/FixJ family response regulator
MNQPNTPRQVLLVSNFSGFDYAPFRAAFLRALGQEAPPVNFEEVVSIAELPSWYSRHASPHVLIVDWTEAARRTVDKRQVEQALQGVRQLDNAACVLMLADEMPAAGDTMHWLDRGATGLLQRDFRPDHLTEAFGEILSRRLQVQIQRLPRVTAGHEVKLKLASLEQGVVAETVNVGTGGLFARVVPAGVKVGDRVDFRIELSREVSESKVQEIPSFVGKLDERPDGPTAEVSEIRGSGVVVWVRPNAGSEGPEGIGIQFRELEGESRRALESFVSARRVRAFIPKA